MRGAIVAILFRPALGGITLALLLLLGGCTGLAYYGQAVSGHLALMARARPLDDWLGQSSLPAGQSALLRQVPALREFAAQVLDLPVGRAYRDYADLGRPWVTLNLVATPALSLVPRAWCFPVVGCLQYVGWFDADAARERAGQLAAAGWDVALLPSAAYSTLGWFEDPLVSPMLAGGEAGLAETLFHELAHRRLYVADDSAYNEAYASLVGRAGTRQWLAARPQALEAYEAGLRRRAERRVLLDAARHDLAALYASPLDEDTRHRVKAQRLERLAQQLASLEGSAPRPLGNAHLALFATYEALVPGLRRLLAACRNDWPAFHAAARALGELPQAQRHARLQDWARQGLADCRGHPSTRSG